MISYTVLIPVYNEAATVENILTQVLRLPGNREILVVDDGSRDGTSERVRAFQQQHPEIRLITYSENGGKGKAVRTGLAQAHNEVVIIQDADLEYDPAQIPGLLVPFQDLTIQAVYGSRFMQANPTRYRRYLLGNKVLTYWINLLTGGHFTDSYTCYKAIRRKVFQDLDLQSSGFEIEAEISVKLVRRKCKIVEHPIQYKPRTIEEGKKINWKDAWRGIRTALKYS